MEPLMVPILEAETSCIATPRRTVLEDEAKDGTRSSERSLRKYSMLVSVIDYSHERGWAPVATPPSSSPINTLNHGRPSALFAFSPRQDLSTTWGSWREAV